MRKADANHNGSTTNANNSLMAATQNWYAKLHPIGKVNTAHDNQHLAAHGTPSQPLNLSIFFRIWLAVAIIIVISSVVAFNQLFDYVKPTTQQVIEDTLVDTSKLLAASLQRPIQTGEIYDQSFQATLDDAFLDQPIQSNGKLSQNPRLQDDKHLQSDKNSAAPWYHLKTHSSFRVYVTDANGVVIYDSLPNVPAELKQAKEDNQQHMTNAEGQDYSQWNDVYLTLRGQYGARSTAQNPNDPMSSIMYVAQPVLDDKGDIMAVVSVGKPVATIAPYLNATRQHMFSALLMISAIALMMAGLVAWWLKQSIALVTRYTQTLAAQTNKPYFYLGRELNQLSDTIEGMKHRLENRSYVTDYVHTLTHELKSPLTAIRASGELLEDDELEHEDRLMLSQTITEQSIKLQSLIDRLLLLAKVEQPTFKLQKQPLDITQLLQELTQQFEVNCQQKQLKPIALLACYAADNINQSHADGMITNHKPLANKLLADKQPSDNLSVDKLLSNNLWADKFWLTQALQNVLDNAVYYASTQVIIRVTYQHPLKTHLSKTQPSNTPSSKNHTLKTGGLNANPHVTLDIFNDGAPIPDYALSKVFERYFSLSHTSNQQTSAHSNARGNTSQSHGKKGTGLGLTLVKQVIEHHGGQVAIRNVSTDDLKKLGIPLADPMPPSSFTHNTHAGVLLTITLPLSLSNAQAN